VRRQKNNGCGAWICAAGQWLFLCGWQFTFSLSIFQSHTTTYIDEVPFERWLGV